MLFTKASRCNHDRNVFGKSAFGIETEKFQAGANRQNLKWLCFRRRTGRANGSPARPIQITRPLPCSAAPLHSMEKSKRHALTFAGWVITSFASTEKRLAIT